MRGWPGLAVLGALASRAAAGHASEPNGAARGEVVAASPASAGAAKVTLSAQAEPAELVPRTLPTSSVFYGWQILAIGETGGLLAAASIVLPDRPTNSVASTAGFLFGMPAFALGGPVAHWSHGDFAKGLVSVGANIAGPFLGGLIGSGLRCNQSNAAKNCGSRGFFDGMAVALVTVPVADALVLGWEQIPSDEGTARREPQMAVVPLWQVGRGAMTVGVAGRF